jgi:hypothetical protein
MSKISRKSIKQRFNILILGGTMVGIVYYLILYLLVLIVGILAVIVHYIFEQNGFYSKKDTKILKLK